MLRKEVLTVLGVFAATAAARPAIAESPADPFAVERRGKPLLVSSGKVPQVGFLVGPDLVPIDAFGPHAVFLASAMATADMHPLFAVTTVAESIAPVAKRDRH